MTIAEALDLMDKRMDESKRFAALVQRTTEPAYYTCFDGEESAQLRECLRLAVHADPTAEGA